MQIRFPATTPRVSRSQFLAGKAIVAVSGAEFEDGLRRLVVAPDVSDESMDALRAALIEIDGRDGMVRWISDLLASQTNGSPDV